MKYAILYVLAKVLTLEVHNGDGYGKMEDMNATVGADVESICRKCGDVWHVVVAMIEGDIVKVQCKECNGLHKYKSSAEVAAKAKAKKTTSAAARKKAADAKPKSQATIKPDMKKEPRPYKFSEAFAPAERIEHVKFGLGIVETVMTGKIEVFFPEGRRVLAVAKAEPTLIPLKESRPAWLDEIKTPAKAE